MAIFTKILGCHEYKLPVNRAYRYYRMFITARNEAAAITVGEWQLLDSSNVNRALGKNAAASNQDQGAAYYAFDGIVPVNLSGGRWQTNSPGSVQWLSVDLGAQYHITKAVLFCNTSQIPNYAQYSPNTWEFQGSNDNLVWSKIQGVIGYTQALWTAKLEHTWSFTTP